jgi:hypothetical protein
MKMEHVSDRLEEQLARYRRSYCVENQDIPRSAHRYRRKQGM